MSFQFPAIQFPASSFPRRSASPLISWQLETGSSCHPTSAATMVPAAMAGPYANLLAAGAARSSSRVSADPATSRPVPASVAERRRRLARHDDREHSAGNGRKQERLDHQVGPTMAPTAAISLTSPAPVAPSTCPGIISSRPTANPSAEAQSDTPLTPVADSPTPTPASARSARSGCGGCGDPRPLPRPSRWRSRRTRH